MDIIERAAQALKPISEDGIMVQQGWYEKSLNALHVTLWNLTEYVGGHSDDVEEIEAGMVQVNIWSGEDQIQLKNRIKKLMRKSGFVFVEAHDEAESDTRIFVNAMRFLLIQEAEETED